MSLSLPLISRIAHKFDIFYYSHSAIKVLRPCHCHWPRFMSRLTAFRPSSLLLKPFRLTGLCLSIVHPALIVRSLNCKSKSQADSVSRISYLKEQYSNKPEPGLKWQDLWMLLRPYWHWLVGAILCAVGVALLNIQLPIYLGELVNSMAEFLGHQPHSFDIQSLTPVALKLAGCYFAQAVLTAVYISFLSVLGERISMDLRILLFNRLIRQDMSFYDAIRTGELSARLGSDVQEFKSSFKLCIAQGLRTAAQTGGCAVSLYLISPTMTFATMGMLPVIIGAGAAGGSLLRTLSRRAQAQTAMAQGVADEAFSNVRTVRAFAMEDAEQRLFHRELDSARHLNELLGVGIGLFQGATNFVLNGIVLGVLYGGSSLIIDGKMSPGDLMSFLVAAQTIQRSMGQLSVVFGQAVKGWTAGARVFEFSYPTRQGHIVLDDLNLELKPGTVTALCGPSGSGKSTIASLLERFYEPEEGRILLDGHDLRVLDPSWLRGRAIGLISQEPVLFATTIAENIRYGKPDASDEEVQSAAKLANADLFIASFPEGYNTLVGERGVTLSGGQKQRIAIARALLKDPPILILDEATSALDAESEKLVREALDRAVRNRTVLVIAHRLSTIQNSDTIAVISGKRVAEIGTHQELLKKRGIYWSLVRSQYDLD